MYDSDSAGARPGENAQAMIEAAEERLRRAHARYAKSNLERIADYQALGRALIVEKASIPHGEWLPMLARLGFHRRTTARAMKLARIGLSNETIVQFGGVQAVLGLPDSMLEKLKADPVRAAELAAAKVEMDRLFEAVAESNRTIRDAATAALRQVAESRQYCAEHRRTARTPDAEIADFEADLDRVEAKAQESLREAEAVLQGQLH